MKELSVSGTINGRKVTAVAYFDDKGWHFLFNDERDNVLESKILDLMKEKHTIGGTYLPKTEKLNIIAILCEGCKFFDRASQHNIQVFGEIEQIPYEEGVIY